VGADPALAALPGGLRSELAAVLEPECAALLRERNAAVPDSLDGRTVVIEFARGGPDGSSLPLPAPYGYAHSLALLSPEILARAHILYVWVTPEESRRKNLARADPNDPGSILHHSVPLEVMMNDYGCDDMDWLEAASGRPGTARIAAHGREYRIPIARFDNRVDKTSFIREERSRWRPEDVRAVHDGLKAALDALAAADAR
jgi:hypothetical protein